MNNYLLVALIKKKETGIATLKGTIKEVINEPHLVTQVMAFENSAKFFKLCDGTNHVKKNVSKFGHGRLRGRLGTKFHWFVHSLCAVNMYLQILLTINCFSEMHLNVN